MVYWIYLSIYIYIYLILFIEFISIENDEFMQISFFWKISISFLEIFSKFGDRFLIRLYITIFAYLIYFEKII